MKSRILYFALLVCLFASCKKEAQLDNSPRHQRSTARLTDPAFLTFTSLPQYDSFIADPAAVPPSVPTGFVSLRSITEQLEYERDNDTDAYLANPHLADTIYESYGRLLDILNEDHIVNLNGWLVRVDINSNQVYSINSTSTESYELLLTNPSSGSVTTESVEYEVAQRIFGIPFCEDPYAERDQKLEPDYCESRKRTKKEITYQPSGILFSLVAEAKGQQKGLGIWWSWGNNPSIGSCNVYWYERCNGEVSWSGQPGSFPHANLAYNTNSHKATFRPYNKSKALRNYNFGANFPDCGNRWLNIIK